MAKNGKMTLPYREVTAIAIILGIVQGVVMTMAFVYAGLQLGFTLPGSTIAAIMGFALLKGVMGKGTIVENNINQTVASGVNIASAGIVFTLPVLFLMMRDFNPVYAVMAAIGGSFLGVAVIIPLRKQMIDFDRLRFPSGTAVGAILKSPGAGKEKAMLLGAGFFCSMALVMLIEFEVLPEDLSLDGLGIFPAYTQTAIYLSLMNLGAGLLAGRGGLPFFFGGCLAFWVVAPVGVNMGLGAGVPQDGLKDFVYLSWIRPIGIGMLIGGALMGVIMAFPSIKSAMKSLAKASKLKGGTNDELSIKYLGMGFVIAFILLFFGAWLGVKDETWLFQKDSFQENRFQPFVKQLSDSKADKDKTNEAERYVFSRFSEETRKMATTKMEKFLAAQEKERGERSGQSKAKLKRFKEKQQRELRNQWRLLQWEMVKELNSMLDSPDFYNAEKFSAVGFSKETKDLIAAHEKNPLSGAKLQKLNRRIIENVCPDSIVEVKSAKGQHIGFIRAFIIALVATLWLALAGVIVAQCTGMTDISPLSGLSLIAVTLILALSGNSILAAVVLGVAVCVATAQCADMMQDLKTGYLIGGIPRKQQIAQISVAWIGPIVALVTLYILWGGEGFGAGTRLTAPQASALQATIQSVIGGNVPLDKYMCGGILGGMLSLLPGGGVGVLVGLAMYLPFSITLGYGMGCFLNMGICKCKGHAWTESKIVPLAAGFIVGEAMTKLGFSLYKMAIM